MSRISKEERRKYEVEFQDTFAKQIKQAEDQAEHIKSLIAQTEVEHAKLDAVKSEFKTMTDKLAGTRTELKDLTDQLDKHNTKITNHNRDLACQRIELKNNIAKHAEDVRQANVNITARERDLEKQVSGLEFSRQQNEKILEDIRDRERALGAREKAFTREYLIFKEQQHQFAEDKKLHIDENKRLASIVSKIDTRETELAKREKKCIDKEIMFGTRETALNAKDTELKDFQLELIAREAELAKLQRRVDNLIEVHKLNVGTQ